MRFDGTFEELKIKLESILPAGEWRVINENQHQFKTRSKGILNWYPSTGTLRFQGKPHAASKLQEMVEPLLESRCGTPSEPDVGTEIVEDGTCGEAAGEHCLLLRLGRA